ncbi:MAG: PilT/PilU family type 4a pilus ATPase [Candidatus Acidiferrum sp.]
MTIASPPDLSGGNGTLPSTKIPTTPQNGPSTAAAPSDPPVSRTVKLIRAMMKSHPHISDLIFSPGRLPQIEVDGQLVELAFNGLNRFTPDDTLAIARDLIGDSQHHMKQLEQNGSTDLSHGISGVGRFRVNIFRQRGTCAIVMRAIPRAIPSFEDLGLPKVIQEIVNLRNGLVLMTGPTGSGKSSTLAAIVGRMNQERSIHILTIEDPIEFAHNHNKATIHQRELHMDTPTFALALRAALRQAPKVILVGEMRDRETIEVALEAAETGHLVMSTLHTIDASKTVERIIGVFPLGEQQSIRVRLAKAFRFIVSQRLLPRKKGQGRIAVLEVLKATLRTREYIEKGESEGKTLLDAMRDGSQDGMQYFDAEIERLIREGAVDFETGMSYSTNAGNLRLQLADYLDQDKDDGASQQQESELEIER